MNTRHAATRALSALQLCVLLLFFQTMGEGVTRLFLLPLPGAVAGMLLLFLFLCLNGGLPAPLYGMTNACLRHMSLLFVPAGAGLMIHGCSLLGEWQSLGIAIVGGTLCTLAVAALSLRVSRRLRAAPREAPEL